MSNYSEAKKLINRKALIVFIKYPTNGNVKTRLAADYDETFATEFYKLCVEKIINEFKSDILTGTDIHIFCSSIKEIDQTKQWLGEEFIYKFQFGKDLGMRMQNAFGEVFQMGYKEVVIIGTDIPELNIEIINNSFNLLNKFDSVIGPSQDGGYYLLGIKQNQPEIFDGVNWSTGQVLNETIQRLNSQNFSFYLLEKLIDVDTAEDLTCWVQSQGNNSDESLVNFVKSYLSNGLKNTL